MHSEPDFQAAWRTVRFAIHNDTNGNSTLYSINPSTSAVTPLPIALGFGFYGGLAWDSATDQFYAIGSDSNANATLFRFALGDQAATPLFGIGQGFLYAALTVRPDANGEPGTSTFVLAALGAAALRLRRGQAAPLRTRTRIDIVRAFVN